jgi:hypothetical protein
MKTLVQIIAHRDGEFGFRLKLPRGNWCSDHHFKSLLDAQQTVRRFVRRSGLCPVIEFEYLRQN